MSFTNEIFFPFLVAAFLLYYLLPLVVRPYILLLASILFYITWGPEKLPFVAAAALIAWGMGLWIGRARRIGKEKKIKKAGKKQLILAEVLLLGLLIWAKAGSWILEAVKQKDAISVIVPLGVSYYTLTLLGYLFDVYYGKAQAEKNVLHVLSFALYFPAILQGPFSRFKDLSGKLREGHRFDFRKVCFGAQLMLYGYFKKMVIADRISTITGTLFNGTSFNNYGGAMLFVGLCLRSLELYCDFSGCMDIAGGISELFGIELAKNFNHPFFAKSAAEFWRRWHITLGTWFKDYVYMPLMVAPRVLKLSKKVRNLLGKEAGKAVMTIVPVYTVWILTGLWHGTGMNYVLWGVYWGTLIAFSTIFAAQIRNLNALLHINTKAPSWSVFQMVRTFLLFTIGRWITISNPIELLKHMVKDMRWGQLFDGTLYNLGLDRPNVILMALSLGLVWFISLKQEKGSVREEIASYNVVFRWAIYYAAILCIVIFGVYGLQYDASSFIYMRF